MLSRIIEAPLKSSVKNDNPELAEKLEVIRKALHKEAGSHNERQLNQKAITSGVDFFESQ